MKCTHRLARLPLYGGQEEGFFVFISWNVSTVPAVVTVYDCGEFLLVCFPFERFYLDSSKLPSKQYSEAAGEGRAVPSLSYVLKITQRGEVSPQSPLELPTIA